MTTMTTRTLQHRTPLSTRVSGAGTTPTFSSASKCHLLARMIVLLLIVFVFFQIVHHPNRLLHLDDEKENISNNSQQQQESSSLVHKFDSLAQDLYTRATSSSSLRQRTSPPPLFVLDDWKDRTSGGLHNVDRVRIAEVYGGAGSVFEWGLGESTRIANYLSVPRYFGMDSDASYVAEARLVSKPWFRFYFADIGPTSQWGRPVNRELPKILFNYIIAPLMAEQEAFDVYLVDGQMRPLCAMAAFLHASKHLKPEALVLIHDYYEPQFSKDCVECHNYKWQLPFHQITKIADMVHHNHGEIATFQRKKDVSDEQIMQLFEEMKASWLQGKW